MWDGGVDDGLLWRVELCKQSSRERRAWLLRSVHSWELSYVVVEIGPWRQLSWWRRRTHSERAQEEVAGELGFK